MALLRGEVEQPVAERLAAVVEGELTGTVGAGGVVHQRQRRAVLGGQRSRCRCRTRGEGGPPRGRRRSPCALEGTQATSTPRRLDDGLPARDQRLPERVGVPVGRARRLDDEGAEQAVVDRGPGSPGRGGCSARPPHEGRSARSSGTARSARRGAEDAGLAPTGHRTSEARTRDRRCASRLRRRWRWLVNEIATQSPSLARITSGWIGSSCSPIETCWLCSSARIAGMALVSAYMWPSGSWSPNGWW